MSVFSKLKKRWAKRIADRPYIRRLVLDRSIGEEELLHSLGANPKTFGVILEGASATEKAVVHIVDNPATMARIARSPKVFEKMLRAVADNPEVLFRLLKQREVRSKLTAQQSFLRAVAADRVLVQMIIEMLSQDTKSHAMRTLIETDADVLKGLDSDVEVLAAAILSGSTELPHQDVASRLRALLGDNAADLLLSMIEADPSIANVDRLRERAIAAVLEDTDSAGEVFRLQALQPRAGAPLIERVGGLLDQVLAEPVVLQALMKDAALRDRISGILTDVSTAADNT